LSLTLYLQKDTNG